MVFCAIGLEVFTWLPIFSSQDKCLAAFADLDQRAFPGNTSLLHSLHLALNVIVISNQSVATKNKEDAANRSSATEVFDI